MLEHIVIYLRNLIFFRIAICVLCCIIIAVLYSIFQQELINIDYKKQKLLEKLRALELGISDARIIKQGDISVISDIHQQKQIQNVATQASDVLYENQELYSKIGQLGAKYKLFEPLQVSIYDIDQDYTLLSDIDQDHLIDGNNANGIIKVKYSIAKIKFKAKDLNQLLAILTEICALMPINSIVLNHATSIIDVLTPSVIPKMNTRDAPNTFDTTVNILLQKVTSVSLSLVSRDTRQSNSAIDIDAISRMSEC